MKHSEKTIAFVVALAVCATLSFVQWTNTGHVIGSKKLIVTFFTIKNGTAIFIETPSGKQVLIDGGTDKTILDKLGGVLPFWDRSIDTVVLSSSQAVHLDGLFDLVDRYKIDMIYETDADSFALHSRLPGTVIDLVDSRDVDLGDGAILHMENPATPTISLTYATNTIAILTDGKPAAYYLQDTRLTF